MSQMSAERLTELLRAYLVSSDQSLLAVAVAQITKACRFGLHVEVLGAPGKLLERVEGVLNGLNMSYAIDARYVSDIRETSLWSKKAKPKVPRIWIPHGNNRFADFDVMVPFCIDKALSDVRRLEPHFPTPSVDAMYLIHLRSKVALTLRDDVEDVVFENIVRAEETRVLSPDRAMHLDHGAVKNNYGQMMAMSPTSLLYLGCDPGDGSCRGMTIESELQQSPLNRHAANWRDIQQPTTISLEEARRRSKSGGSGPAGSPSHRSKPHVPFPFWIRRRILALDQVATVERNIRHHEYAWINAGGGSRSQPPIGDRLLRCLRLRLEGSDEKRIRKRLGFADEDAYNDWLTDNHIDFAPSDLGSPHGAWLNAAAELGIALAGHESVQSEASAQETSDVSFYDVAVKVIDDHTIRLWIPGRPKPARMSFEQCGMAHKQTGEPHKPWAEFIELIENGGKLTVAELQPSDAVKTTKARIKKMLCERCGIDDDPFERFVPNHGWKLKLQIRSEDSTQTRFEQNRVKSERDLGGDVIQHAESRAASSGKVPRRSKTD